MSIAFSNHGEEEYLICITTDDRVAESHRFQTIPLKPGESHLVFTKYTKQIEVRPVQPA